MEMIDSRSIRPATRVADLAALAGQDVPAALHGAVHRIRDMGGFSFLLVRTPHAVLQAVLAGDCHAASRPGLREEACVRLTGRVSAEARAPHGIEFQVETLETVSAPAESMPFAINRWKPGQSLETELGLRPVMLRNSDRRARFRIQAGIVRGFRDFLHAQGFTEIRSPKLQAASAEGGANVFALDYFGQQAFLAQSPQFYKQMMVGVYERVFEAGPVFRAERHNTARHLNEYTSLDFEMGYIDHFTDICAMEAALLAHVFDLLQREHADDLALLGIGVPQIGQIPQVRFREAKELVARAYGRKIKNPYDLEPEEELLIGRYFQERHGSDFVFVTHYPARKRPFYTMDDPEDPRDTLSFDLLFRGLEITTGGQRIHTYQAQVDKMVAKGLDPAEFATYLQMHRYGMPPHGGLGLGLERLCMKLFGDTNIRLAAMFPRDMGRLDP